jgi:hypothetical protein
MAEMTGAAIQESSSVSEEPADPASHTPVRQTVYRTEAPPASQRNPMVDPEYPRQADSLPDGGAPSIPAKSNGRPSAPRSDPPRP